MIKKHSVNNTLMVTWANAHYLDFVLNWASHVEAANISTYLVGALDDELLEALVSRGVPTFAMRTGLSALRDLGWGSPDFFLMVHFCPSAGPPLVPCFHFGICMPFHARGPCLPLSPPPRTLQASAIAIIKGATVTLMSKCH